MLVWSSVPLCDVSFEFSCTYEENPTKTLEWKRTWKRALRKKEPLITCICTHAKDFHAFYTLSKCKKAVVSISNKFGSLMKNIEKTGIMY